MEYALNTEQGQNERYAQMKDVPRLAQEGGVCMGHGAKWYVCIHEGCTKQAKKGGVCIRHGAKKRSNEGCTKIVHRGGVCWRHRADRTTTCSHETPMAHVNVMKKGKEGRKEEANLVHTTNLQQNEEKQYAQEAKKMANKAHERKCKGCGAKSEEQFTPGQWKKRFEIICKSCQSKAFKEKYGRGYS